MSEIYRGSVAAIHQGQFEAAAALNLPARSRFFDVLCPQIFRVALPASATFAIGLLKDSAIASTIGVLEITFQAYHLAQQTYRGLEDFALAGLIYILISLPIAILARRTDTLLRSKVAR
jgi:polar amino acid transport system permease protein